MKSAHSIPTRAAGALMSVFVAALGCQLSVSLDPASGSVEYQRPNWIAVPGGAVNAAGGNLLIERVDVTLDTVFGTSEIRATYNSRRRDWIWNFQMFFDGSTFVDSSGAVYDVSAVADGSPIPGTFWVRESDAIRTKGGWEFHFDGEGRLSHAQWMTIDYPRIDYRRLDDGGVPTLSIEQCTSAAVCAAFFVVRFDAGGLPTQVEEVRTGRTVEYGYDGEQLVAVKDPLAFEQGSSGTRYEYAPLWTGLLTATVNAEGERIEFGYQARSRIRKVVQIGEGNPTHRFEFNAPAAAGGLYPTIHSNPMGGVTRYEFDPMRRLHRVERVETGEEMYIDWVGMRPSRIATTDGAETHFSYTGDDPTQIVDPAGNVVSISYQLDALDQSDVRARPIASITDAIGLVEQLSYGADGRLLTAVNGAGDTVAYSWAPITLASSTNPLGATFDFPIYGIHGHWLEVSGSGSDRRSIDPVGNVLVASTGRQPGGILSREYDPNRNVSRLNVAASSGGSVVSQDAISIQRRGDGELLYVARPGGGDHWFEYDALGRVLRRSEFVDGSWQATTFEYDLAGHVTAIARPNGMREEYDFDPYGRMIAHRGLRDGVEEGEELFVYRNGRIASRTDSIRDATELYGYDSAGRLASVAFAYGESVTVEYDARSRVVSETLSWPGAGVARRIEYEYDLANRVTRLGADDGEMLAEWVYQDGAIAEIRYGNGLI